MEAIAKSFVNAHGQQFKTVFAETLTRILHPIGKVRLEQNGWLLLLSD